LYNLLQIVLAIKKNTTKKSKILIIKIFAIFICDKPKKGKLTFE